MQYMTIITHSGHLTESLFSIVSYYHGHILNKVDVYKCLGILLSKDLSWSPHVNVICSKACKILGLLYRRFYRFSNSDMIRQLYISLVRPHLEYACHVWAPHTSRDINVLESVQKFACKLASHRWNGNTFEELLVIANLPTLERRRLELKLCHLFKIIHNLVYFPNNVFVNRERSQRSTHHCLSQPFARTNSYFYSFVPHTISIWNRLPAEAVSLSSISSFKTYLYVVILFFKYLCFISYSFYVILFLWIHIIISHLLC